MEFEKRRKHDKIMRNAKKLCSIINEELNIEPVFYGKLALEEYFNLYIDASVVEFLLPDDYVTGGKKDKLIDLLSKNDYEITGNNTFKKNDILYIYDSFDKFKKIYNINLEKCCRCFDMPRNVANSTGEIIYQAACLLLGYYILNKEEHLKIYIKDNNTNMLNIIDNLVKDNEKRKEKRKFEEKERVIKNEIYDVAHTYYYDKKLTDCEIDIILTNKAKDSNKTKDEIVNIFNEKLKKIKELEKIETNKNTDIIEIVSNYSALGNLMRTKFNNNKIINIENHLALGDLNELKEYKRESIKDIYDFLDPSFRKSIDNLYNALNKVNKIRIWSSHKDADAYLLVLYICNLLKDSDIDIYVIYTDEYDENCVTLSNMMPNEIEEVAKKEHKLSSEEKIEFTNIWIKLVKENSDIRYLDETGKILSVSYDYFDDIILNTLKKLGTVEEVKLLVELMINNTINNMGDSEYSYLINKLIKKDKIELIDSGENNYKVINYNSPIIFHQIIKIKE